MQNIKNLMRICNELPETELFHTFTYNRIKTHLQLEMYFYEKTKLL